MAPSNRENHRSETNGKHKSRVSGVFEFGEIDQRRVLIIAAFAAAIGAAALIPQCTENLSESKVFDTQP